MKEKTLSAMLTLMEAYVFLLFIPFGLIRSIIHFNS